MSKKEIDEKKVKETVDEVTEAAAAVTKAPDKFRKLKYGTMFYVIIALVIAVVVILNIMVNVFAKRSPMKIDITPDNRYELTDESINAVKALDKDVDIVVTNTRDYFESLGNYWESYYTSNFGVPAEVPYEMIPELLDKYSVYAQQGKGSINVKYVDLDKDPDAIAKYNEEDLNKLKEKLEILKKEIGKGPENIENVFIADNVFHDTVSEMGHNPIVDRINNVVREMTYKMRYRSVLNMLESGRGDELYDAHETIYKKILNRDPSNLNEDIRRTYFPEEADMDNPDAEDL